MANLLYFIKRIQEQRWSSAPGVGRTYFSFQTKFRENSASPGCYIGTAKEPLQEKWYQLIPAYRFAENCFLVQKIAFTSEEPSFTIEDHRCYIVSPKALFLLEYSGRKVLFHLMDNNVPHVLYESGFNGVGNKGFYQSIQHFFSTLENYPPSLQEATDSCSVEIDQLIEKYKLPLLPVPEARTDLFHQQQFYRHYLVNMILERKFSISLLLRTLFLHFVRNTLRGEVYQNLVQNAFLNKTSTVNVLVDFFVYFANLCEKGWLKDHPSTSLLQTLTFLQELQGHKESHSVLESTVGTLTRPSSLLNLPSTLRSEARAFRKQRQRDLTFY